MLTVIFGAGASYDLALGFRHSNARLPLAAELFDNRFASTLLHFQPVQVLASRLSRNGKDVAIEAALGRMLHEAEDDYVLRGQLFTMREYLQVAISDAARSAWGSLAGRTNYLALVDEARRWGLRTGGQVALVTFNYDTLLDQACEGQGMEWTINRIDDYITREDMRLYKVHGSTSWFRAYPGQTVKGDESASELGRLLGVVPKEVRHDAERSLYPGYAAPAIAIPVDRKYDFECPDLHIERLRLDLGMTKKLVLIGWRASEPHFTELLRDHLHADAAISIVSGSQEGAEEVARNLAGAGVSRPTQIAGHSGFSNFIAQGGFTHVLGQSAPRGAQGVGV